MKLTEGQSNDKSNDVSEVLLSRSLSPSGLVHLNLLDLSGNLFPTVPRHLPPSLQQLYLSNNSLSGLEEDCLVGFSGLRYLRLSHCGLQSPSIHPLAFNLSSLVELDLSYNKLSLTPTVPTTLQYLYLEANQIYRRRQHTHTGTHTHTHTHTHTGTHTNTPHQINTLAMCMFGELHTVRGA